MAINSVTKSLARFTRPLRSLFSRKELARLTRIPRTLLTKGGVGERLIELENRFERLQRGWNQHVPGLLESMSDALDAAHHAEDGHRRVDALREDLDRLSSRFELHLLHLASSRQGGGDIHRLFGVTFTMVDDRGLVFSSEGRDLPIGPGSIRTIAVSAGFKIALEGEGLDELLAGWFALLAPNGRLEIDRFRLVELLETPGREGRDESGAMARAIAVAGLAGSTRLPTNDQISQGLARCGFQVSEAVRGSDDLVRTLVARRPPDPGA